MIDRCTITLDLYIGDGDEYGAPLIVVASATADGLKATAAVSSYVSPNISIDAGAGQAALAAYKRLSEDVGTSIFPKVVKKEPFPVAKTAADISDPFVPNGAAHG